MALLASLASTMPDTAVAQSRKTFREEALGETADTQQMGARLHPQANEKWEWEVGIAVSVPPAAIDASMEPRCHLFAAAVA